jgi:hypothetical protein
MLSSSAFRRFAIAFVALVIAICGGYAVYWNWMAGKLSDGLAPWAEARRAEGYRVEWENVAVGGFPMSFRYLFTKARFSADRPLPATLEAPRLVVSTEPWNLRHWRFRTPEGARLADPQSLVGFDLGKVEGSAGIGANDVTMIDVAASSLDGIGLTHGATIANASAHLEIPREAPARHQDVVLDAALRLIDVKTQASVPGFGDTLSELSFAMQLKGALPPGSLAHALAQWRDQGGTVELKDFHLRWGALLVDANGTLALDNALQPEGAFSAIITGQDAVVDLAVTAGVLHQQDATIVKAVLSVLAKPGPSGEKAITVPLTVQQSRIYLGPAAIGTLPPINWEEKP